MATMNATPLPETYTCPRCGVPTSSVRHGWACPSCVGVLVAGHAPVVVRHLAARISRTTAPASSLSCPGCRRPMTTVVHSGVEIDACIDCQLYWFDAGELSKIEKDGSARSSAGLDMTAVPNDPSGGSGQVVIEFSVEVVFEVLLRGVFRAVGAVIGGVLDGL